MKIPESLKEMLDATGLEWNVVNGKKHVKIFVAGYYALGLPHGNGSKEYNLERNQIRDMKHALIRINGYIAKGKENEKRSGQPPVTLHLASVGRGVHHDHGAYDVQRRQRG